MTQSTLEDLKAEVMAKMPKRLSETILREIIISLSAGALLQAQTIAFMQTRLAALEGVNKALKRPRARR